MDVALVASYQPSTIEMVAAALASAGAVRPHQLQPHMPFHLSGSTISAVLLIMVRDGRAVAEGEPGQRRYRAAGQPSRDNDRRPEAAACR